MTRKEGGIGDEEIEGGGREGGGGGEGGGEGGGGWIGKPRPVKPAGLSTSVTMLTLTCPQTRTMQCLLLQVHAVLCSEQYRPLQL